MSIEAQIAQIISSYDVAFNAGEDAGVVVGGEALLFRETNVADPKTGEPLGVVRRPSLRFRITEVHPKFSVGTTVDTVRRESDALFPVIQTRPERVRVTAHSQGRDYRTRVVEIGQQVEILPPKDEKSEDEAAD